MTALVILLALLAADVAFVAWGVSRLWMRPRYRRRRS